MFDFLLKLFGSCCCIKSSSDTDVTNETNYGSTTNINKDVIPEDPSIHYRDVRIGAFNIKRFGVKKFNDDFVINYLLRILSRYDFVLIQEVQDSKLKEIAGFVDKLSKYTQHSYTYVVSDNLGRKRYKEQYLYIYRSDLFEITDQYHYEDGSEELEEDTFEREPFILLVKALKSPVKQFAVIGAHIRPDSVEKELTEFVNVYDDLINRWKGVPVVMMGDFNAGSSYLSKRKMKTLSLRTDERFHWLIENEDTTVSKNNYTHDRIIIAGDELVQAINADSAKSYKFDEEFNLSMEEALRVSDHYPVEFILSKKKIKDEL